MVIFHSYVSLPEGKWIGQKAAILEQLIIISPVKKTLRYLRKGEFSPGRFAMCQCVHLKAHEEHSQT
jgi:hypothetical protein